MASHRDPSWHPYFYFNIYTSDLPTTLSSKYAYADDLEVKVQHYENGVGGLPSQQQGS